MAEVNVLLTCAGQRVDIVRAFQQALADGPHTGRVVVSDLNPLSPSLFSADAVVELPPVDEPGYGAAVAETCEREGVKAVLPLTDLDPVILAEAAPAITAAGAQVFLPSAEVAAGCQDKWQCHEMLLAAGLPSPPTWLPDAVDHATLPYPVLVKPRIGFGARNIWRANDPAQLAFFLDYTPVDSVIQQMCSGTEFSTDCLGDLSGRAIGAIPRAMLEAKGGEQIKGETLDDAQLVDLAARTVEALGLRGPSTVQCFRDASGEIQGITDINTRFGGGFPLPHAAGGDYPGLILRMAAGETVEPRLGAHTAGVVMTRYLDQHILGRQNGSLGTATSGPARTAS
jgi:carbamoyl-phosphate synthase large subunit